jgi:hypothetical protein
VFAIFPKLQYCATILQREKWNYNEKKEQMKKVVKLRRERDWKKVINFAGMSGTITKILEFQLHFHEISLVAFLDPVTHYVCSAHTGGHQQSNLRKLAMST